MAAENTNSPRQNIFALFEKDPIEATIKLIRSDLTIALVQKLRQDDRPAYRLARQLKIKTATLKALLQGNFTEFTTDELLRLCMRAQMRPEISKHRLIRGHIEAATDLFDVTIRVRAR